VVENDVGGRSKGVWPEKIEIYKYIYLFLMCMIKNIIKMNQFMSQ
jgi:hypothetical protein